MRSTAIAQGSIELIDLQVTQGVTFRDLILNSDALQEIFWYLDTYW